MGFVNILKEKCTLPASTENILRLRVAHAGRVPMGWKWKEVLPFSSCLCFRKKGWEAVPDQEDDPPRRGGVSYERRDKNAQYIQKLADTKSEELKELKRRFSGVDWESNILERLKQASAHSRRCSHFHTAQGTSRRQRVALKLSRENESALDRHYDGQAQCLLATADDWSFNIFSLDKLTNGRSLFHMCLHLFQSHGFAHKFNLDIVKLMKCFTLIEEGYNPGNPYHNAVHAADVTQAMHCYLREHKVSQCVTPLEAMVALFAAATHDLDHPGVNQAFLVATSNHLAALYKNCSVLENHHWRAAIGVLRESGVFDHFSEEQWKEVECLLRSLILSTDIARQQEFLGRFKNHLDNDDLSLQNQDHRHLMLQIALKCADICNPCRPWLISRHWSQQVCDEFFKQGDIERQLKLPISPSCDRYSTTVAQIQIGFMEFVALPLFLEWQRFNPTSLSAELVNNILTNKRSWENMQQDLAKPSASDTSKSSGGDTNQENSSDDGGLPHTFTQVTETALVHMEDPGLGDLILDRNLLLDSYKENLCLTALVSRRHSLPFSLQRMGALDPVQIKQDVFQINSVRRHSLPTASLVHSASLNHLRGKMECLAECSPANGSCIFSKEELMCEPIMESFLPLSCRTFDEVINSNSKQQISGPDCAQNNQNGHAPLSAFAQNTPITHFSTPSSIANSEANATNFDLVFLQNLHMQNCSYVKSQLYEVLSGPWRARGDSSIQKHQQQRGKGDSALHQRHKQRRGSEDSVLHQRQQRRGRGEGPLHPWHQRRASGDGALHQWQQRRASADRALHQWQLQWTRLPPIQ